MAWLLGSLKLFSSNLELKPLLADVELSISWISSKYFASVSNVEWFLLSFIKAKYYFSNMISFQLKIAYFFLNYKG